MWHAYQNNRKFPSAKPLPALPARPWARSPSRKLVVSVIRPLECRTSEIGYRGERGGRRFGSGSAGSPRFAFRLSISGRRAGTRVDGKPARPTVRSGHHGLDPADRLCGDHPGAYYKTPIQSEIIRHGVILKSQTPISRTSGKTQKTYSRVEFLSCWMGCAV